MRPVLRLASAVAIAAVVLFAGTAPAMAKAADRNHNKIPDKWERKYHLSIKKSQAKKDTDKDGLTNINEYLAGTNPRKKDTNHNGVKDGLEDKDKDGLVNLAELAAHTKINVADTDKDGVKDALEDPDEDTLNNAQEWAAGTDPLVADSDDNGIDDAHEDADADGLDNWQEFQAGENPRMADSDHDGVLDGDEDCDGDGIGNSREFADGTDPLDPDTDGDGIQDGRELQGVISSFDADTGELTFVTDAEEPETITVTVDEGTALYWVEGRDADPGVIDDGETVGMVASSCETLVEATMDDLVEGTRICDIATETQEDGTQLATRIVLASPDDADIPDDPSGVEIVASVTGFDSESGVLSLQSYTGDCEGYDVFVDESTQYAWADGTTADHDATVDDLVEGTDIAEIEVITQEGGPDLATLIVLVPPASE
jgi:hypothetical protein